MKKFTVPVTHLTVADDSKLVVEMVSWDGNYLHLITMELYPVYKCRISEEEDKHIGRKKWVHSFLYEFCKHFCEYLQVIWCLFDSGLFC